MNAGRSADVEAQQLLVLAEGHEASARIAREQARNYQAGAAGERKVGGALIALEQLGWTVLADRRWGRRSNIDFLLIGPAGVVVVDAKQWRNLQITATSIFRDDECQDDELEKMRRLGDEVADVLAELGITPSSVLPALVFVNQKIGHCEVQGVTLQSHDKVAAWLTRRPRRFEPEVQAEVAELLAVAFPEHTGEVTRVVPKRRRILPRVKATDPTAESAPVESPQPAEPVLIDVDELTEALLAQQMAGPIEEWMTFLHPGQLKLVSTKYRGAARVRGSAGTGKTVVGLHRAAHLAKGPGGTIFFVTFVRTLPQVLRSLVTRLAPEAVDRIRFTGLHQLALHVLDTAGHEKRMDRGQVDTAFARAWLAHGRGSLLESLESRPAYWQEEIDYVIKGRGLTEFGDYAELRRTGRGTRMTKAHREVMWDLYVDYAARLERAGTKDFNDWLIDARDLVLSGAVDLECGGVIVDEVQDLTMVGLQFLHALAGEGQDRFLMIGDGQQSIYPGGFTLSEAGIDVRGRATVLEVNYRNTAEILAAAQRVIEGETYDDIEGEAQHADNVTPTRRHGDVPVVVEGRDRDAMLAAVTDHIDALVAAGVRPGDLGVLLLRAKDTRPYADHLARRGHRTVSLEAYDGTISDRIKVGTVKRAKGLEFAHVLLPEMTSGPPAQMRTESDDAHAERVARHHREVFVAMTRARDGLWVGHLVP